MPVSLLTSNSTDSSVSLMRLSCAINGFAIVASILAFSTVPSRPGSSAAAGSNPFSSMASAASSLSGVGPQRAQGGWLVVAARGEHDCYGQGREDADLHGRVLLGTVFRAWRVRLNGLGRVAIPDSTAWAAVHRVVSRWTASGC